MGDAPVQVDGARVATTTGVLDRVVLDGGRVGLSATACARITDPAGAAVGSGFLVAPGLVATCAHVVAPALGADPAGPAPVGPVAVDLPLLGAHAVRGTVVRWLPVGDDGHGDVALLRLAADLPGAVVPPARGPRDLWDRAFRTFGFPEGRDDGVWATGVLRAGQATGWIQLQTTPGDQRIGPGFSGAPVWDAATGAVVGMTVAADRDTGSTTAYLVPIADVLGLDPELTPCPYRGVEPFGEEHASLFHGREADVARLLAAVAAAPLVMVIGPSGSGKSSLVAAGLVPRLRAGGTPAVVLRADPDPPGPARLAGAVLALTDPAADDARRARDADRIGAALASAAGRDAALAELGAALSGRPRCTVVIDQFEELVETAPDQARMLLEIVARLASPSLCAVVTLRAAALDDVLGAGRAAGLTAAAATVLVGPLDRAQLREVVTGPARRPPGLDFEDGLVERILDDVPPGAGQLPLLESLLARLWAERVGGTLTGAAYAAAGGVAGALAARAEDAVAAAEPAAATQHVPDLLRRLAGIDRHGRALRRRVRYLDLPDGPRELVALLAAHRVVVVTGHGERSTVELAHAALTDQWPRLHDLVAGDRDFLRWRTELDLARHRWEDGGRDPDALLRGSALAAAETWTSRADEIAAPDRAFLAAGRDRRRRERRRRRAGVAVLAVAALVAALLAVTVVRARGRIDVQAAAAAARTLAQAATDHQGTDPLLAAELALAAYHAGPDDPAVRTALVHSHQALSDTVGVLPDTGAAPQALRTSATGTAALLAVGKGAGPTIARFGDPTGVTTVRRIVAAGAYATVTLSPDGRRFAALRADGGIDVVDEGDSPTAAPRPVVASGSDARTVEFSADSRLLGWLSGDVAHAVWHTLDPSTGAIVADRPLPGAVTAVPVDRDGLAAVGAAGGVTLVDTRTGTGVRTVPGTVLDATGTLALRCADEGGDTMLHATTIRTGAERALAIGAAGDCDRYLTAGEWVLTHSVTLDAGVSWRATSLIDGAVRWFVTPPMSDDPDTRQLGRIALMRSGDEVVAFAAVGPRVLRLRTRPDPAGAWSTPRFEDLSDDGRWLVVRDGSTMRTIPAGGGPAVSTVPQRPGGGGGGVGGPRLWWLENLADAPTLTGYDLTDLSRQVTVPFPKGSWTPGRSTGTATVFGRGGDGPPVTLVSLDRGELTVHDARSGAPAAARIALAASPADAAWFAGHAVLAPRRGQPDQVLVGMPDGHLALWDARAGRHLLDLPVPDGPGNVVATATGDRAATVSEPDTVRIWDLTSGRETRTIRVPVVEAVLGFTSDGQLIVIADSDGIITRILAIDAASGAVTTTFPGDLYAGLGRVVAGDRLVVPAVDPASGPRIIPLDPRQWRDGLCRVLPPDPSPALAALLPPGTPPGAPCPP